VARLSADERGLRGRGTQESATYGPSALATPANAVTVVRLLASPLLFALIAEETGWWSFAIWTALALTDGVDGWVARRYGTTRSGAFLDPLADKVLVLGAMAMLVAEGRMWWVPVLVIGARELAVSLLRSYWGRRGLAVPATNLAKLKTWVQAMAVGWALLPPTAEHAPVIADVFLWTAVGLTLVTGYQYFSAGRSAATAMEGRS